MLSSSIEVPGSRWPCAGRDRWRFWAVLLVGLAGCEGPEPVDDRFAALNPGALVPLHGVVTIHGKPRRGVVITFLPASGAGVGNGETDQDGKFELKTMGRAGTLPGAYKVAISYLVSDKGEPQGLGPRSGLVQGPAMLSAREQLPPEYSDLGRTRIVYKVAPEGGRFDFDVPIEPPIDKERRAEDRGAEPKKG